MDGAIWLLSSSFPTIVGKLVMCLARLGLKAPALAWLYLALAYQKHEAKAKIFGLARPGFGPT